MVLGPGYPLAVAEFDNFIATGRVAANLEVTEDFNASSLDSNKCQAWKSTIVVTAVQENGVYRVTIPPGQTVYNDGVIRLRQAVAGDFAAQVDLKVESVENKSTADTHLIFSSDGESKHFLLNLRKEIDQQFRLFANTFANGQWGQEIGNVLLVNGIATVKIARIGSSVSFYYQLPGQVDFILLGTRDNLTTAPGNIQLVTNSWGNFPAITGTFDNFRLITSIEALPTLTPTLNPIGGAPNDCGGTCGSNSNCQSHLICSEGFCRNPQCPATADCSCVIITPVPTPVATQVYIYRTVYPIPKPSPTPTPTITISLLSSPTPTPYVVIPSLPLLVKEPIAEPASFWERVVEFFKNLFGF